MEASPQITGSTTTTGRQQVARSKKIAVIAALGLAGFLSVTACTTTRTVTVPAAPHSQPVSATPAQQDNATDPDSQQSPSPDQLAQYIANIAVGNGPLNALAADGVTATDATCDPQTVSDPPDVSTPTTASCDITYSDDSVWQQTVTITYDNEGQPLTASTNSGTELSQPAN